MQSWGGVGWTIENTTIEDMNTYQRSLTGEGAAAQAFQGGLGSGIEHNAYPPVPTYGEMSYNGTVRSVRMVNCRGSWNTTYPPTTPTQWAYFMEDTFGLTEENVLIDNDGQSRMTPAASECRLGAHRLDAFAAFPLSMRVRGCEIPYHSIGASPGVGGTLILDGANAETTSSVGLSVDSNDASSGLALDRLVIGNFNTPWNFGGVTAANAGNVRIAKLNYSNSAGGAAEYTSAILARNATGGAIGIGAIVELGDAGGIPTLVAPTTSGASPKKYVVCGAAAMSAFTLIAPLGGGTQTANATGAITCATKLEVDVSTKTLVPSAADAPVAVALSSTGVGGGPIKTSPP